MADTARATPPWHLWAVGIVSLLWNAIQGYDYILAQLRDPTYLAQVPREMEAYLDSFPAWSTALWAIGVWGSVLGSVLLLARSRHASYLFLAAWLSTAITYSYHYIVGVPPPLNTPTINTFKAVIFTVIVLFWWYARRMRDKGVLG